MRERPETKSHGASRTGRVRGLIRHGLGSLLSQGLSHVIVVEKTQDRMNYPMQTEYPPGHGRVEHEPFLMKTTHVVARIYLCFTELQEQSLSIGE